MTLLLSLYSFAHNKATVALVRLVQQANRPQRTGPKRCDRRVSSRLRRLKYRLRLSVAAVAATLISRHSPMLAYRPNAPIVLIARTATEIVAGPAAKTDVTQIPRNERTTSSWSTLDFAETVDSVNIALVSTTTLVY